jgi:hypothetical protein
MSMGITPSKAEIDLVAGTLAKELHIALRRASEFKQWMDAVASQTLIDLGYTGDEEYMFRQAFVKLDLLRQIYNGEASLPVATNLKTFPQMLFGIPMEE